MPLLLPSRFPSINLPHNFFLIIALWFGGFLSILHFPFSELVFVTYETISRPLGKAS